MKIHSVASFLLLTLVSACSTEQPPSAIPLEVTVLDSANVGVEGARIRIGESTLGITDTDGRFTQTVSGAEGRQLSLQVTCPEGTTPNGPQERTLEVRLLKKVVRADGVFAPLRARFHCKRLIRSHVVVVRTNLKESFPVQLLGETVGQTGDNGAHQFIVDGAEGEEIEVRVDTGSAPRVRPASPARKFLLPATSGLLVFDQIFQKKEAAPRTRPPRRRGPRRL